MPSIHSVAQIQHRKQEKIEIIERKFKEILEKDYGNQSSYKNTEARNHELATLLSQMENWFDIPFLLEDAKKETSPKCKKDVQLGMNYCSNCGQKLLWKEEK